MKFTSILAIIVIALSACQSNHSVTASEPSEEEASLTIPYGETKPADDGDIKIRFAAVKSESRCPLNANCVWKGEVTVELQFIKRDKVVATHAISSQEPLREFQVENRVYVVRLISVLPYPVAPDHVQPKEYHSIVLEADLK